MSLATVTVTVLPVFLAQASAAALTALVSASPEERDEHLEVDAGPLAEAGALEALSSSKPAASAGRGEQGAAEDEGEGRGAARCGS